MVLGFLLDDEDATRCVEKGEKYNSTILGIPKLGLSIW
jgi:hypothetical protein